jgi:Lon protease-like protein
MDILARGCRAFQCVQVVNEQPFLEADIEVLSDNNSPNNETEDTVLRALYQHAFQIFFGNVGSYPEPSTTALLAFRLAAELPLEWDFKQKLLEIRSETERRKRLREHLEQIMPLLTELHGRRSKQKGNNSHVN